MTSSVSTDALRQQLTYWRERAKRDNMSAQLSALLSELLKRRDAPLVNPFDHAAIMGDPRNRRISMNFEKQEQYEAALVFLDMGDSPREPSACHPDPTGKTREPPHCPSCSCGTCNHNLDDPNKTLQATLAPRFGWYCTVCGEHWYPDNQAG